MGNSPTTTTDIDRISDAIACVSNNILALSLSSPATVCNLQPSEVSKYLLHLQDRWTDDTVQELCAQWHENFDHLQSFLQTQHARRLVENSRELQHTVLVYCLRPVYFQVLLHFRWFTDTRVDRPTLMAMKLNDYRWMIAAGIDWKTQLAGPQQYYRSAKRGLVMFGEKKKRQMKRKYRRHTNRVLQAILAAAPELSPVHFLLGVYCAPGVFGDCYYESSAVHRKMPCNTPQHHMVAAVVASSASATCHFLSSPHNTASIDTRHYLQGCVQRSVQRCAITIE